MMGRGAQVGLALALCLLFAAAWRLMPHPALVVALGLAPLAVVFVLWAPFLMVLLFVIFSFFRIHEAFPQLYPLHIPQLLALSALGAIGWHSVVTGYMKPYWRRELTLFALFFGLVTLGVLFASNRPTALAYYTGTYVKIGIMTLAIVWLTRRPGDFALASKSIVAAGIAIAIVALNNKIHGIGLVEGTRVTIGRDIRSMLGDPNDLSLVLMFPLAFAVSLMLTKGVGVSARALGFAGVPLLIAAVIATQSRGGLLGILAVSGIYGYQRVQNKALFFGAGGVLAIILPLAAGISDRASGGAGEEGIDASAMGRLYAWEAAFKMATTHPFTGVGLDNFFVNYFFYSPHWDGKNHAVHSTWFGVLAETGFLGFALFVTLIVMLLRVAWRTHARIRANPEAIPAPVYAASQAALAGLLGTIVSGTFLTQGFTWPIYILTALVVAVAQWVDEALAGDAVTSRTATQQT